jgi:hypothetical protein
MINDKKKYIYIILIIFIYLIVSCSPIPYLTELEKLVQSTHEPIEPTPGPTGVSAYITIEGENFDDASPGLISMTYCVDHLGYIDNNTWALYAAIDFETGITGIELNFTSERDGSSLELRLDDVSGTVIGSFSVPNTGGLCNYQTDTIPVSGASGVHDLYFVFYGTEMPVVSIDWFRFFDSSATPAPTSPPTETPTPTPILSYTIYSDSFLTGWEDWSWSSTVDVNWNFLVYNGTSSIKVVYNTKDAGFYTHNINGNIFMGGYTHLRFIIHGGSTGGQTIKVYFRNSVTQTQIGSTMYVDDYIDGGSIPPDTWEAVTIPLTDFGIINQSIGEFIIQNEAEEPYISTTIYCDMIGFF